MVTYFRVLIIRDKAIGKDMLGLGSTLNVNLDTVGIGIEMIGNVPDSRAFTSARIQYPDSSAIVSIYVFGYYFTVILLMFIAAGADTVHWGN